MLLRSPRTAGLGHHREQHRVVVPVVRALHLHDAVAAGGGAGHADGVHGGLGPGVDEPHLLQPEPLADLLGQRHRHLGGDGEVRPVPDRLRDRLDDLRVRVAHDVDAEPAVAVHVLARRPRPRRGSPGRARGRSGTGRPPGSWTPRRRACCPARAGAASRTPGVRSTRRRVSSVAISAARIAMRSVSIWVLTVIPPPVGSATSRDSGVTRSSCAGTARWRGRCTARP